LWLFEKDGDCREQSAESCHGRLPIMLFLVFIAKGGIRDSVGQAGLMVYDIQPSNLLPTTVRKHSMQNGDCLWNWSLTSGVLLLLPGMNMFTNLLVSYIIYGSTILI
jgi:hypothetical protein